MKTISNSSLWTNLKTKKTHSLHLNELQLQSRGVMLQSICCITLDVFEIKQCPFCKYPSTLVVLRLRSTFFSISPNIVLCKMGCHISCSLPVNWVFASLSYYIPVDEQNISLLVKLCSISSPSPWQACLESPWKWRAGLISTFLFFITIPSPSRSFLFRASSCYPYDMPGDWFSGGHVKFSYSIHQMKYTDLNWFYIFCTLIQQTCREPFTSSFQNI